MFYKKTIYRWIGAPLDCQYGTYVDIFPIENFPKRGRGIRRVLDLGLKFIGSTLSSYKNESVIMKELMKQDKEAYLSYRIRRFIGFFFSFLPYYKWARIYDKFVQHSTETGRLHDPTGDFRWIGYEKSVLLPPRKMKFEGHMVYVPNKVEEYLTSEFGADYMQLPPPEMRIRHYAEEFKEID